MIGRRHFDEGVPVICPVHGCVPLTRWEWHLVNTPTVRRLQRIAQTGFNFLTFSGAHHTRFEHSIGTLLLSWRLFSQLYSQDADPIDATCIRLAALLHDVGHGPFSHASEFMLRRQGILSDGFHESVGRRMIKQDLLLADGFSGELAEVAKALVKNDVVGGEIPKIARGLRKRILGILFDEQDPLHGIISGDIDVDRMDYMLRDSHYSGVPFGMLDNDLIIRSVIIDENGAPVMYLQGVEGIKAAEALLLARDQNFQLVNYNPRSRFWSAVLDRAFEDALTRGHYRDVAMYRRKFLAALQRDPEAKSFTPPRVDAIWEFVRLDDIQFWSKVCPADRTSAKPWVPLIRSPQEPRRLDIFYGELRTRAGQLDLLSDPRRWKARLLESCIELELRTRLEDAGYAPPEKLLVDIGQLPDLTKVVRFRVRRLAKYSVKSDAVDDELDAQDMPLIETLAKESRDLWRICLFAVDVESDGQWGQLRREAERVFHRESLAELYDRRYKEVADASLHALP